MRQQTHWLRQAGRVGQALPLLLALLITGLAPAAAQDGGVYPVIMPENASQLSVVNSLWRGTVDEVAWSPRGDVIAVGTSRGVWLYDADDLGAEPRLLPIEQGWVLDLAFAPDGTRIAASLSYDAVVIWDVATGKTVMQWEPGYQTGTIAWGPDGTWIAVQWSNLRDAEYAIQIWDAATGTHIASVPIGEPDEWFFWNFALSPNGHMLAARTRGGLLIWDRAADSTWTAREFEPDPALGEINGRLAFSPDNATLVLGTRDRRLIVFDTATWDARVLQVDAGAIYSVAYSPAGDRILTVGNTINLWDANSGDWVLDLPNYGTLAVFNPDGSRLLASTRNGAVTVIDSALGIEQGHLDGFGMPVNDLASTSGEIAVLRKFGSLWLWDEQGDAAQEVPSQGLAPVGASAFNADGSQIVVADYFGAVKIVDPRTGQVIMLLQGDGSPARTLAYSANGTQIASLHEDGTLRLWDATTGTETGVVAVWDDPYLAQLTFSPDGSLLAAVKYDEALVLYDLATRTEIASAFLIDGIDSIAFSPDSTQIAASWSLGGIVVWHEANMHGEMRPENAIQYYETLGGGGPIVYNPQGTLLAASDGDTLRVFDVASGAELFSTYADQIDALVWTPDGTQIITGGVGGVVRVWAVAQ